MEGERWWSKRNGRAHMVLRRTELLPSVRAGFLPSVLDLLSQALVKVIQRCSSLLDNKLLAPRAVLPLVLDILSPAAPSPWAPFDPGAQIPDWSDGPVVICVAAHRCLQLLERLRFGERKKWFG